MAKRQRTRTARQDALRFDARGTRTDRPRGVLLSESALVFLQKVVHAQMPELVKYGFYEMGFRAGIDASKQTAGARDKETAFRQAVEAYKQAGYGDIRVVSYDLERPEILLSGHDLFETSAARQSGIYLTPRAVDHYSRGMLAGLISQLLGKEVICEEMKCEFRGDDACEFTILPFGGLG